MYEILPQRGSLCVELLLMSHARSRRIKKARLSRGARKKRESGSHTPEMVKTKNKNRSGVISARIEKMAFFFKVFFTWF